MNNTNNKTTFGQWAREYIEEYVRPSCKPSAAEHYEDNLYKHALPFFADKPLEEIDAPAIQKFLNEQSRSGNLRTGGPLSPKSLRNLRTALSGCFSMAVALGKLPGNPVPNTVIRRSPRPQVETMGEEELKILMDFLNTDYHLMNFGLIVAIRLGIRRGEICAMQWKDYDERSGQLTIQRTVKRLQTGKTGGPKTELVFGPAKTDAARRTLALPPDLQQLFSLQKQRYAQMFGLVPDSTDFIFYSSSGGLVDPDHLTQYFSDVLAGLGLPHVKLHALRHTFASQAVAKGIDVETVSGLLGHTDVTTTTHYYLHPRQENMNKALWSLSPTNEMPPASLPAVFRGKTINRKFLRRDAFPGQKEAAV